MINKSRIYQALELKEIERIVKKTFDNGTTINSYEVLKGGLFNTTYLIKASNPSINLVLRVAPIREELLYNFEKSMMRSEPLIYKLLEDNGVPTAKVIKCDYTHEVIPRDYIIMEYIDGIPLNHPSFPKEYRDGIQEKLGAYTAKIHNIKSNTFGWINSDSSIKGSERWSDVVSELAQEVSEKAARYNLLDSSDIKVFDDFFRKNITLFDINVEPSLVHNDLWDPNVLVKKVEDNWEITAIIDADRALFAHSEYEYAMWGNDASFMKGYGKELDMSCEGILRRKAYTVILSFILCYVNKVQFDNESDYENAKNWALNELSFIKAYI